MVSSDLFSGVRSPPFGDLSIGLLPLLRSLSEKMPLRFRISFMSDRRRLMTLPTPSQLNLLVLASSSSVTSPPDLLNMRDRLRGRALLLPGLAVGCS